MNESAKATDSAAVPYERLKQLILDGELRVGEPLVERTLADRLGVSRTPVREAILRLESEGLISMIERRGSAFVASYAIDDLIEIYEIREGLEPLAARLSCARLNEDEIARHEKQLKRYRADPKLRDRQPGEWLRLGRDFHNMFIYACGNDRLIQTLERMRNQIELFRGLGRAIAPRDDMKTSIEEHWEILQALKKRDPERAEAAVRLHLKNGLKKRREALDGRRV